MSSCLNTATLINHHQAHPQQEAFRDIHLSELRCHSHSRKPLPSLPSTRSVWRHLSVWARTGQLLSPATTKLTLNKRHSEMPPCLSQDGTATLTSHQQAHSQQEALQEAVGEVVKSLHGAFDNLEMKCFWKPSTLLIPQPGKPQPFQLPRHPSITFTMKERPLLAKRAPRWEDQPSRTLSVHAEWCSHSNTWHITQNPATFPLVPPSNSFPAHRSTDSIMTAPWAHFPTPLRPSAHCN